MYQLAWQRLGGVFPIYFFVWLLLVPVTGFAGEPTFKSYPLREFTLNSFVQTINSLGYDTDRLFHSANVDTTTSPDGSILKQYKLGETGVISIFALREDAPITAVAYTYIVDAPNSQHSPFAIALVQIGHPDQSKAQSIELRDKLIAAARLAPGEPYCHFSNNVLVGAHYLPKTNIMEFGFGQGKWSKDHPCTRI